MIQKVRKPQNWKAPFTHTQTHKHRHTCTNCTQKKTQHRIHTGVVYMPSCDTVKVLQLQGDIPDSFPPRQCRHEHCLVEFERITVRVTSTAVLFFLR